MEIKAEPRTYMNISQNKESNFSPKENLHVDILECANPGDYRWEEEAVSLDVTSSSSSFNDSICVPDDSGLGDEEAQSVLCEDYPLPSLCDGTEFFCMRKKKLKDDWRRFIRPIMWRCRWLELKVKEFQSQARKYKKEIASYHLTKRFELEKLKSEDNAAKSIPFSVQAQRARVLKRRKRKRVEETTDVALYMSSHNLFSYAVPENRMPATASRNHHDLDRKCTSKENEIEDDCLVSEIKFSDDFVSDVLRKIDGAREKVQKLKRRVDELMCEPAIEIVNDSDPADPETEPSIEIVNGSDPADPENNCLRQPQPVNIGGLSVPAIIAPSQTEVAVQNVGQSLINVSPSSFGGVRSIFPIFDEDVEEKTEMKDDEREKDEELQYFRRIINEVTGVPRLSSEEPEPEDDPAPATMSTRVKTRKRKRQPTWMSSTSARRRAAALRQKTSR